ncbi:MULTISPECIES: 2-hydroxycarboxylate transporter family protein [Burkholderiaceae]|uniref:Malate Na(+) symporter n=1 Tax=Caballeronia sordidicola TaxID=196367 RepID=A0A242MZ60_CABSO|nr:MULTISPECIES: 2-hydroxycarboxylate transporter family protein [Burkholderiaceae]AME27414.1 malate permease [Burkholderia sp. PAMC 26561]AME28050.1 malate permease [Burkholderia sp. PAMC 26561]OTP76176.1 Malate Na(+) symporter [Caballeronia sordidicola]
MPVLKERVPFWPNGWWTILEIRVGIIPLPVYVLLVGLIAGFALTGKVPGEISMALAILVVAGFTCAEIGKRLPVIRKIGGAAILATFLPSYLAYHHFLPARVLDVVVSFTKVSNFLYLFIASIIVGSIFSMDRTVLVRGFTKIFIPLAAGTVVAGIVGTTTGWLLGLGFEHTLLFVVIPIMAGGVGEGAIPLSVGYSEIMHLPQGPLFAQVLPTVMIGSLTAILFAGALSFIGEKLPHLTGKGVLQRVPDDLPASAPEETPVIPDVATVAAGAITAISLYLVGLLCHRFFGLPAPVSMLFVAVLIKLSHAVSPQLQSGARIVYQFFSVAVTYPLLFAIGTALTPWNDLVGAISMANVATIVITVFSLMATGFVVARWVNIYPIEAAIVNACHSGQGGTGDVAILSACDRMSLMPFAQIATRIGGAITVTITLLILSRLF